MKPVIIVCITVVLLSCKKETVPGSVNAQSSSNAVTQNESRTTTYSIDVNIYSDCTQEFVHITGDVQLRYHAIQKENGGYHITSHDRNLHISGVGVTSGKPYKALGNYNRAWNYETKGGIYKIVSKFILMTPGAGNNLVVTSTVNYVVNEDGEFKVSKTEDTAKCQ